VPSGTSAATMTSFGPKFSAIRVAAVPVKKGDNLALSE
jgi:hypothetical protein